jgi:hypothetical protein
MSNKIAIAQKIAQKTADKKKGPIIRKKVTVKKQVTQRTPTSPEDGTSELQNLMELIDIKGIVQELVRKELVRLGFTNTPSLPSIEATISEIDDPMDIDLVRIKNGKELATVEGKIGNVSFSVGIDSMSNKDIMPKFIADELGLKINTNITHNIRGVSGKNKSLGIASATVVLAPGCIIKTDFAIIDDYHIREIILGRPTLKHRYNYDLFESREHVAITCNGKNFFIPIVPDINRQVKKDIEKSPVIKALSPPTL